MVFGEVTVRHILWSPSVVSPVPCVRGRTRTKTLIESPSPLLDQKTTSLVEHNDYAGGVESSTLLLKEKCSQFNISNVFMFLIYLLLRCEHYVIRPA